MMTAEQLKASILQLAMQGKLVEQRAEEGTAQQSLVLLNKLNLKRTKSKDDLDFSAMDFEIPDSWIWIELNQLFNFVDYRGKTPHKTNNGIFLITASNIRSGYMEYTRKEYISEEEYLDRQSRGITHKGDLLFTTEAPMGNAAICDLEKCSCGQRIITFQPYCEITVFPNLYMYFILSPSFQKQLLSNCTGTTAKGIKADKLKHFLIPLPPLEEQKRIVAKIEELMLFVEQYAKASTRLNTLNASFPDQMKKSILQQAVMGKLVPQDPNDEPASVLLKKIAEEKQKLIKEGKIKKQKALPAITEDEIPFEIPESWEWVRMGSILTLLSDGTHRTPKYQTSGIPFISVKDMSSGTISFDNTKYISEKEADELNVRCNPERGDVLLSKVGTTGVPAPVDTDIKFSLFVSVALLKFNTKLIDREFLINVILSPCVQKQCAENTRGVGNKNWVMRDIANTLIPIPPLEEQYRIVQELNRIVPHVEMLMKW